MHGNIIVPPWTISTDHEGEKGREGAGEQESSSIPPRHGSRRAAPSRPDMGAGEQLHPAPTWEHGGWRMEDHGMEDDCVSTRWPITMACRDGILLSHYWNGILLQYYCNIIVREYQCWGRPSPHATPCSMFHGPCSMVHVPWSMFHGPCSATEPLPFPSSSSSPTSTSSSSPSPSPTWNPNPGNPNPGNPNPDV